MNEYQLKSEEDANAVPPKRIELHLHTKMSQMDALISPEDAIQTAKKHGFPAIAITDHGTVQAFPAIMRAAQTHGVKAIYGIEINYVNDMDQFISEMVNQRAPEDWISNHMTILVQNQTGLKNLYQLVTKGHLEFLHCKTNHLPIFPKAELEKYRSGLLFGSACHNGELFRALMEKKSDEEIEKIVQDYDFLEIQPIASHRHSIEIGLFMCDEDVRNMNRSIVTLGEKYNKPVVATCNAHYLNPNDDTCRQILLGEHDLDNHLDRGLYLRSTEEMLDEFSYLGKEKAFEVVVENTNRINDRIETVFPLPNGYDQPTRAEAEVDLRHICMTRVKKLYGDVLPPTVSNRLNKELSIIQQNGYATHYMIAKRMVDLSENLGYHVGSRGSVGSSLVAYGLGITDVNPLPPHYYCPECHYTEFFTDGFVKSGFDLTSAACPECQKLMKSDGHNIPIETFLGFYGERFPDIDLNFAPQALNRIKESTNDYFGKDKVFDVGAIGTLSKKTASEYIKKYFNTHKMQISNEKVNAIVEKCIGVKRITEQHTGGLIILPEGYEIHDFTPLQYPDNDPTSKMMITHFPSSYLHDTVWKLDVLEHRLLTQYRLLENYSGVKIAEVPMNDPEVYELFQSGNTLGLPEFGTKFVQDILTITKPKSFSDLLQISGLTHGTNTWIENAEILIRDGVGNLSQVVAHREDILLHLTMHGIDQKTAFLIMESVRKGKGLTEEHQKIMRNANLPEWYIDSCKKIKYLFPKAHAIAYVMAAIRIGWYKVHYPQAFYCACFATDPEHIAPELLRECKERHIELPALPEVDRIELHMCQ